MFSQMCIENSVHEGVHPPRQTPPLGRQPPPGQTPPSGRHPPRQIPPWADTSPPQDSHCSGRYASYWNAFLFGKICATNCMEVKEIDPSGGGGEACPWCPPLELPMRL